MENNDNTQNQINNISTLDTAKEKDKDKEKSPKKDKKTENNTKIKKRNRRTKEQIKDRQFKCPLCEKSYSSGPALTTHKKQKHDGELNNLETKSKGRPTIYSQNVTIISQRKFSSFFINEKRKPTLDNKIITLDIIKQYITEAFELYQSELYTKIKNVEDYPLYKLVIENWDLDKPKIKQESYLDDNNKIQIDALNKVSSPCIDDLFYLYLKECSIQTNKDYFFFMIKFVILFRENINEQKKGKVTNNIITENSKEFTQLFNGSQIPELCNDFFVEYLDSHNYFNLEEDELIELVQHFCYWLYKNSFSAAHLSLANN